MITNRAVDGSNRLHFRFFPERTVKRISRLREQLTIHEVLPPLHEVVEGTIAAPVHTGRQVAAGVYDCKGRMVEGSVPYRGANVWNRIAPPQARSLERILESSKCAYYLGYANTHYGHFLLETISRAWAWERLAETCVPVLQTPPIGLPAFAKELLGLIPGLLNGPSIIPATTRFSRVVVAHPAFVIARAAYSEFKTLCDRITERALGELPVQTEQPLYLSRAGLHQARQRTIVGEDRLERFLASQGFCVIRPETLPVTQQIALFNKHKHIVSPVGSACHTRLFSCAPTNCVVLCDEQINPNYLLSDQLCAGQTYYANVLSTPAVQSDARLAVEPLIIGDERLLALLAEFGLIRPDAQFGEPAPGLEEYKQRRILVSATVGRKKSQASSDTSEAKDPSLSAPRAEARNRRAPRTTGR